MGLSGGLADNGISQKPGAIVSSWEPGTGLATIPRDRVLVNMGAVIASGTLHLFGGIVIPAGKTITSITHHTGTTALSGGSNQWFNLVDPATLKVLAVTSDDTSTAWTANAAKTLNLSATYTPTQDQAVYVGIMVNATGPPTLLGIDMNSQIAVIGNTAPKRHATSSTSQTTPIAVGQTVSGLTTIRVYGYAYLS